MTTEENVMKAYFFATWLISTDICLVGKRAKHFEQGGKKVKSQAL